jgi:peroxiredoxin
MTAALALMRLALALVFGAAGTAKMLDRNGTQDALVAFGVPRALASPASVLLPVVELIIAGGLLLRFSATWAAAVAFALLVAFSAGLANSLMRGRRPPCHCFGQLASAPASWGTIGRNAILAGAAIFVAVTTANRPEPAVVTYVMFAALCGLGVAIGLSVAARRFRWLSLDRLEVLAADRPLLRVPIRCAVQAAAFVRGGRTPLGLRVGSRAPEFDFPRLDGQVTLASLLSRRKPTILLFSDVDCRPCIELLPTFRRWQREYRDELTIAVIVSGSMENDLRPADEELSDAVLTQPGREVADAYKALVTPSAVAVTAEGKIGSRLVVGPEPIQKLVEALVARGRRPDDPARDVSSVAAR